MATAETIAAIESTAQAALAVESVIGFIAQHIQEAQAFNIQRVVGDDGAVTITIHIPKFKLGSPPQVGIAPQ